MREKNMMKTLLNSALIFLLVGGLLGASSALSGSSTTGVAELEDARVFFVFSATDDDAQVFLTGGSDLPIARVSVRNPAGEQIAAARFADSEGVGQADFAFESPEPSLDTLKAAYPAGTYVLAGRAVDGTRLTATVDLSHELLAAPELIYPMEGDEGVPVNGLIVAWNPIEDAESIRLEIEDEEEEVALKVDLDGDATAFEVPNSWLKDGVQYVLDIKATAENGNQTVSDVEFVTAD